jgi:maleate isomerase
MPVRFGVLTPVTNVTLAADLARLEVPGVSICYGRLAVGSGRMANDAEHAELLAAARASLMAAIAEVVPFEPTCLIIGLSIESFWGGVSGSASATRRLQRMAGERPVVTGAAACVAALSRVGARRIGIVTPYQPAADAQVRRFFVEAGFEVASLVSLAVQDATAIAAVGEPEVRAAIHAAAKPGTDAIVQCGTNLSVLHLIEAIEAEIHQPLLAMNAVTYWHALRLSGIAARPVGFGQILSGPDAQ